MKRICNFVLISGLFSLWSVHALAGEFRETFDNPFLPEWEYSPGVAVVDGVLRIEPDNYAFHPGEWDDLILSIIARRIGEDEAALQINYCVSDNGDYAVHLGPNFVSLRRAGTELAASPIDLIPPNEWVHVNVTVFGGIHEVVLSGQPALTVTDSDPLPPGGVTLSVHGEATGEFDDLIVTFLGEDMPAYQSEPWVILGGPPGGIGYDIRMVPENPDIMYVTDSGGGIFKSINGGQSWVPINEGLETLPGIGTRIFCATIDPHDSNTVWIGTQFSARIYRSTDGGQTWEERSNGIIRAESEHSVRGITIDPNDPNIVYAALEDTTTVNGIGNRSFGEVYKSTDDGLNWTRIWRGENLARYVWIDPRNTQRLFVSTGIFDRNAANAAPDFDGMSPNTDLSRAGGVGILRSEDGGQTWTVLDEDNGLHGGLYVPSLYMHPQNPDILIAAVSSHGGRGVTPGVYMTQDGGDSWNLIQPAAEATGGEVSMEAVEISSSNPNIWYAAATDVIHRSDDGGQTWVHFPMRTPDRGSGIPIDLQVDPRDPYRLFENGYGGGNMMSTDGGQTWVDASQGYSGAAIWGMFVDPEDNWTVTVSANTANFRSTDGGQTWQGITLPFNENQFGSFRGRVVSIQERSGTHIIASGDFNLGYVFHSTDGGDTWEASQVVDINQMVDVGELVPSLYVARALAFAPSDPQTVYIGYGERYCLLGSFVECPNIPPGFFRSQDGGYTWERVENTPFRDFSILSITVSLNNPRTVFAATMGGAFRSQDGGDTWQSLASLEEIAPAYPDRMMPSVFVFATDPIDSGTIYAGSPLGGVYRSDDDGDSWVQAGYGMDANEEITDLLPDANRPGVIYASTRESGVFYTTNRGKSWIQLNEGINNTWVDQLALSDDGSVLYAGTHVSGVIRLGTPAGVPPEPVVTSSSTEPSKSGENICRGATASAAQGKTWFYRGR